MNPASIIMRNNNFLDAKRSAGIITVASKCGEGKTLLCNSMMYYFLELGINVIMFSEGVVRKLNPINNRIRAAAIIVENFGTYENTIDTFNKVLNHHIPFLNGKTVIILDSPLFLTHNSESMVCDKIKCENTRYVLFEKINSNNKMFSYTKKMGTFESTRRNIEALQELSHRFNLSIITTTQLNRSLTNNHNPISINMSLALSSNLIITTEKNRDNIENSYTIRIVKSRYSNQSQHIECVYDNNSHSFVTKR